MGSGLGKGTGVHKDAPKARGSAAALDHSAAGCGAGPCHYPDPKVSVVATHRSPASSTSFSPRNKKAEKTPAEGEMKRKKTCIFGVGIDPPVGMQCVPPSLRPSTLMSLMGCWERRYGANGSKKPSPHHPAMNIPASPRCPFQQCRGNVKLICRGQSGA